MAQIPFSKFQNIIYDHYRERKRKFPWRSTKNPYRIFVSEVMLQQTQTATVLPKYLAFIKKFPDFRALAKAPLSSILRHWQGLGYNRRGVMLHRAAKKIVADYNGILPKNVDALDELPGIGEATASAICAFAFNMPVVFIETNIRRVFLHFFFPNKNNVHDEKIMPLIKKCLDTKNPREWYYALMDYGAELKNFSGNPNTRSRHYTRQSAFKGSDREVRGEILRLLLSHKKLTASQIEKQLNRSSSGITAPQDRVHRILAGLLKDGIITKKSLKYLII